MTRDKLRDIFDAIASPYRERAERYRDWRKESYAFDKWDDAALRDNMERAWVVKLRDVQQILDGVRNRLDYRFNDNDWDYFIAPYFKQVTHAIERGEITAHLYVEEKPAQDSRVAIGDMLDILYDFDMPDGRNMNGPKVHETVFVPVDPPADESTWIGRLRKKFTDALPLRTPSSDVKEEERTTEKPINIYRPLLLALGMAATKREQTRVIDKGAIPTYRDTEMDRKTFEQRMKARLEERYYRGVKRD